MGKEQIRQEIHGLVKKYYDEEYAKDEIKVLGPFSKVQDLVLCDVPENYRIATKDEVVKIIKNNQIMEVEKAKLQK